MKKRDGHAEDAVLIFGILLPSSSSVFPDCDLSCGREESHSCPNATCSRTGPWMKVESTSRWRDEIEEDLHASDYVISH